MFVKKFEADSIEEALKAVKYELGPDAIILKTITNNGLKGAFKKKKIEITAAISEQNFEKKAKVDKVLNKDQKEVFYQKPASTIKESIQKYSNSNDRTGASYGSLGLNRVVNTISKGGANLSEVSSKTTSLLKNTLDDFLTNSDENEEYFEDSQEEISVKQRVSQRGKYAEPPTNKNLQNKLPKVDSDEVTSGQDRSVPVEIYQELKQEMKTQQYKMELLEKKILDLTQNIHLSNHQKVMAENRGLEQLRTTLKTLDVEDSIVVELIRRASLELSKDELDNPDIVFEFALKEMASSIQTDTPIFSKANTEEPVLTVLISETSSGQSSMAMKIALLKKDAVIIQFNSLSTREKTNQFSSEMFSIKTEIASSISEAVGMTRKILESGKSVVLDFKNDSHQLDETKKFFEALRRGFKQVEILGCISGIHAELYNRKIIARYKDFLDGVIISHVDLCLSFGALFNLHKNFNKLPLKFFGTGPVVPDDIEGATAERLMAGLFQF